MAENEYCSGTEQTGGFKEAVCIDAMRVYDSCSDKDCLEDLRVYFPKGKQELVNNATNVRIRTADLITVYLDLQPVPFNKGFYSVDITFYFDVGVDLFHAPKVGSTTVHGVSMFNKKVILYGSEGNVKMFSSDSPNDDMPDPQGTRILPKATVQVAHPVALSARICDCCNQCCEPCQIPEGICRRFGDDFAVAPQNRNVYATIGLFIIVQIVRNVQMLIPAYDFCIPEKECTNSTDSPCELFQRIDFPTDEFFPPKVNDNGCGCGCGCGCGDNEE